jgi:hypothetical protein
MTLMELLTYIGLLAIIMVGSVFSAYSILLSVEKSNQAAHINTQSI